MLMAIRVTCPACHSSYSVADDLRGKKLHCRECEEPVVVSNGSTKMKRDADVADDDKIQDRKGRPVPPKVTKRFRDDRLEDEDDVEVEDEVDEEEVEVEDDVAAEEEVEV